MEHNIKTPPKSLSRASTIILDGHESEVQMTPLHCNSQSPKLEENQADVIFNTEIKADDIVHEPHKMLMQTAIFIEYGRDAKSMLTIHAELLRSRSQKFERLWIESSHLREVYAQIQKHRHQLASFVFPEVTYGEFEKKCMEKEAISLVLKTYDSYPLAGHLKPIRNSIDTVVEEQFYRKNTKTIVGNTNGKKRERREMSNEATNYDRLFQLNARGMHDVVGKLFTSVHKIHKTERENAKTDFLKGVAQSRIIVPDTEDTTVRFFVQWLYHDLLDCQDPRQLYALLKFSVHLGTDSLSELCLVKLHAIAYDGIHYAQAQGISISSLLLGNSPDVAGNLVSTVFDNVLRDENPPDRLLHLVIDTLADHVDTNLWIHFKERFSREKALQLIEVMIGKYRPKTEDFDHAIVLQPENGLNVMDQANFCGSRKNLINSI